MEKRNIGSLSVSPIGLGCMSMSHGYGPSDEKTSIQLLNEALDVGYDFLDTATMYGGGRNEELLAKALKTRRQEYVLASKCALFSQDGKPTIDGRAETIKAQCEASLQRLKTDVIDLYYLHRLDPKVPIEESVGALANLVREGKIREIGLSEVSADTLRRAHDIHPIAAVQSEYSLWTRLPEIKMLDVCESLGTTFVPFSPLGRQFLTGKAQEASCLTEGDIRTSNARPRFETEAFAQNSKLLEPLREVAQEFNCSLAQLALAWIIALPNRAGKQTLIPIPGTKHIAYMRENIAAMNVNLPLDVAEYVSSLIDDDKVIGARYNDRQMKVMDSERDRN
ncbi:aldo/keto reductase [Enterovibrio norvegicus FF-33]|uniref:Aldo/keto reductase n=1 Tax=Enterovibrio norvegicus FF-454 TaxID=1185651 RepID=A0A1E5CE61_9GAMM|nr:aldo/keto reductase [Enterovibrio norvegicus]OEE63803.1 aldo/keto reductase [Enterovibrio norvegicus FF-454]OEE66073.1 aldo/keto reductase [Enterovibrio norvegicus FF-33]